jgi:hypothetical protein
MPSPKPLPDREAVLEAVMAVEELPPIEEQPIMRFFPCTPCPSDHR